jgi:hypothetical protein
LSSWYNWMCRGGTEKQVYKSTPIHFIRVVSRKLRIKKKRVECHVDWIGSHLAWPIAPESRKMSTK